MEESLMKKRKLKGMFTEGEQEGRNGNEGEKF